MGIKHTHCKHGHEITEASYYQTYNSDGTKNGHKCRYCERAGQKVYRAANPQVMYKSRTEHQLRRRYGITSLTERDNILASQNGSCKICKRTDCMWGKGFNNTWHIDHKHGAEGYRAILCARCNIILGSLRDDPTLAQGFVEYIQTHG